MDSNSLTHIMKMWTRGQSNCQSSFSQQRLDHPGCAGFAVCASNMDSVKRLMRRTQYVEQIGNPVQVWVNLDFVSATLQEANGLFKLKDKRWVKFLVHGAHDTLKMALT
jgi:hypothetical protein